VNRVEKQGVLLLRGLRAIYVALAAFASATLVTLLGRCFSAFPGSASLPAFGWSRHRPGILQGSAASSPAL